MRDIQTVRDERVAVLEKAKGVRDTADAGEADLSTDQLDEIDTLLESAEALKAEAELIERTEAQAAQINDAVTDLDRPTGRRTETEPSGVSLAKVAADMPWVKAPQSRKLMAFSGPHAQERAYNAGQWCMATLFGNEKAARWCREHGVEVGIGAIMTGDMTSGGALVPEELETAIIDLREIFGLARQECGVFPMATDTKIIPRRAGSATAYAVGPGVEITESNATFDQVELTARKWGALTRIDSEIMEDAVINLADFIANDFALLFAEKEDDALFNGDGTSTYHGILGIRPKIIDGTHTQGAVDAATNNDTFAEITANDLSVLMGELPTYANANAKWWCSNQGYANVFARITGAAGGATLEALAGPQFRSYLGFPIVTTPKMPTTTGDLSNLAMILFGDMRMATTFGDRRGFRMAILRERYAEFDQIGIIATERFDINAHDLGDNTTGGPIVALIGE